MPLTFPGSKNQTIGVEIELQILDPKSWDLSPQSEKILDACLTQKISRVKAEIHQSMLEVDSEISKNIKECREFLTLRLMKLNKLVKSFGLELGITGTHPIQHWSDRLISNSTRYQMLHEKFQWLIRRMNVYGLHVHIGTSTGDRAIALCQAMNQYLPCLLALSANSPFWQGIDTGMQSSRINILDTFPFRKMPLNLSGWNDFTYYYNTLHKAGAISSFKDFYWQVRPNLVYGTVEVRICDAMSNLDETMALVALIQCLVYKINKELDEGIFQPISLEDQWIAPENQWIAARHGLDASIIVNLKGKREKISKIILDLIDTLSPIARKLNCLDELLYLNHILLNGNGAQRQRNIYNETKDLKQVIIQTQKEFEASYNAFTS